MKKGKVWFTMPVLHADYPVQKAKNVDRSDPAVQARIWYPPNKRAIKVEKDLTTDQMRSALWHEFFHAVFHEYGDEDGCDNESKVEAFAQAVMRVRRNVPWM